MFVRVGGHGAGAARRAARWALGASSRRYSPAGPRREGGEQAVCACVRSAIVGANQIKFKVGGTACFWLHFHQNAVIPPFW
jgi:hypothetical protein